MSRHTPEPKSVYDDVEYDERLDALPGDDRLDRTVANLEDRGFEVVLVDDASEALAELKTRIPAGATTMNGHSTTLEQIGFVDYLVDGDHDWVNLHEEVLALDGEEAATARRESQTADYFLGSVNAIAESGELLAADASGSRVGAYPFAAKNLLLVSGVNKVVADLDTARDRLQNLAYRLEDARARDEYGTESVVATELTYRFESEDDRTTLVLVEDRLGF
jgi:hypothetical protein